MDSLFSSYGKNKFPLYVFLFLVVKKGIPIVFQINNQTKWENLENGGWMAKIDKGDGL